MNESKLLTHYVQKFFQDYLKAHRGLSSNTVLAYRDAIKLFLAFLSRHTRSQITNLSLDDLSAENALAFLSDVEKTRQCSVITRNLRLSALRTFFGYLVTQDTLHAGQYQRVVSIPIKQSSHRMMEYLEVKEVKAIIDCIDRREATGRRDYALLNFLYNTGARVQEACDLRIENVHFEPPPMVTITGKGRKTRQVPLWPETATLLKSYIAERGPFMNPLNNVFLNARGQSLTRFGVRHIIRARIAAAAEHCLSLARKKVGPHTFRHTTAMHLLQSGVDLTIIKNWLGHVSLDTTHAYVEIDLEMKR
ncbi:MAG: site-specific integrase, partial [Methanosarcinaceae archaeon]|nr:site-specific integrase [Methanosarcinaceae archaeon]